MKHNIDEYKSFSVKLVIFALFIFILFFLYSILSVIKILFFSIFLSILISPFIKKMKRFKIPDFLWIIIVYIFILFFIILFFISILPILIKQSVSFIEFLSLHIWTLQNQYKESWLAWFGFSWYTLTYLENFLSGIDFNFIFSTLKDNFSSISQFLVKNLSTLAYNWTSFIASFWMWIFTFFTTLIFTFFILLEREDIKKFFFEILPNKLSNYLAKKEPFVVNSLYEWLKWQMLLGISMFFIVFISLNILKLFWIHLENTFTLALIAWLMEFVPYLWPIIALIPAIAIAAWVSWNAVIVVFILYIVIQQIENNFLVPYIMWKTLNLSPFLVLLIMIIWASVAWIIWIIIAIPIAAISQIFVKDYLEYKKKKG